MKTRLFEWLILLCAGIVIIWAYMAQDNLVDMQRLKIVQLETKVELLIARSELRIITERIKGIRVEK